MSDAARSDQLFGEIAIKRQIITGDKLERALVIQRCIFNRSNVSMPIGAVLQKMGLLNQAQVDEIIAQQAGNAAADAPIIVPVPPSEADRIMGLTLTVAPDKLSATLTPIDDQLQGPALAEVKLLLSEEGISFGLISDQLLSAYLKKSPLPAEPFVVARGSPPVPGHPPEIRYYFDTDPMRIGTLLADGTMDWKNRGEIPQVAAGDLLAEKLGGDPGTAGTNILGEEVPPPRIKDPPLKFTKGAERSEDGKQIFAKIHGTPKLGTDGRIGVFAMLPIETDIGIETGHIDFDGHIEVNGGVSAGYTVKARSLNTKEIQNATIEISENLVSFGGVYGSTLKVGGTLKASHIHNCTAEISGDLVVEKELFNCKIEVNGRCIIESGKIIGSTITAKKGIQVRDIGTQAARPSDLTVGVDFKFEREMEAAQGEIDALEKQKTEAANWVVQFKAQIESLELELGKVAQEQDVYMVQKRQLEEKLNGPAIAKNPEKRALLEELINDLSARYQAMDQRVSAIMARDDQLRAQIAQHDNAIKTCDEQIQAISANMEIMEESAKIDPGIPVIKASGIVYSRSIVAGPHKKMIIPEEMQNVRIAETQEDGKQYQIKISSLR